MAIYIGALTDYVPRAPNKATETRFVLLNLQGSSSPAVLMPTLLSRRPSRNIKDDLFSCIIPMLSCIFSFFLVVSSFFCICSMLFLVVPLLSCICSMLLLAMSLSCIFPMFLLVVSLFSYIVPVFSLISARGERIFSKQMTEALRRERHKTLWARSENQQSYERSILLRLRKPCFIWKAPMKMRLQHEDAT